MDLKLVVTLIAMIGLFCARLVFEAQGNDLEPKTLDSILSRLAKERASNPVTATEVDAVIPLPPSVGSAVREKYVGPPSMMEPDQGSHLHSADSATATFKGSQPRAPRRNGVIAIEPSAEPASPSLTSLLFRRDPLEQPLIDDQAWTEWILSVVINGQTVSDGSLVIEAPVTKRLAVPIESARLWRLIVSDDQLITFQGAIFLPLDNIADITINLDRAGLLLELTVPAEAFEPFALELDGRKAGLATASNGLFLDYDMLMTAGDNVRTRLDGLLEAGAFSTFGVATTSMQLSDLSNEPDAVRLETTITRDFPEQRRSIRLGDSLTAGGDLARSVRFVGLQWGTNFATDPTFVSFPLPAIGGLTEQESVVDVIIDNLTRATGKVPSGPFSVTNVPAVSGRGEVQLKVTDLLGRERLITQPYYVSDRLLRKGLHDHSYAIGFEREKYGAESFDYDRPLATALHRYGLSNSLTLEGYGEVTFGTARMTAGTVLKAGNFGIISGSVSASADDEKGLGASGRLAYEITSALYAFSIRSDLFGDDYSTLSRQDENLRRVDQANFGLSFGKLGRLGLLYLNRSFEDKADSRSLSAAYNVPVGKGSLSVRAGHVIRPDEETAITVGYNLPLGDDRGLTMEYDRQQDDSRGRSTYRKGRGASDLGLDYRLSVEAGENPRRHDGRISYAGRMAAGSLDLQVYDGDLDARANLSGSLAYMNGSLNASRRLGRAFGLVSLPGYSDVTIYMDNREVGKTDALGNLLVPGLRPFENNRIRFEVDDLPLEAEISSDEQLVTPFDRAGVQIRFDVKRLQSVTAKLVDHDGTALPVGTLLSNEENTVSVRVGRNGFSHIQGSWNGTTAALGTVEGGTVRCNLTAPDGDQLLPDLGEIKCDYPH